MYKSYEDLPMMLSVHDVAEVLGISKSSAYHGTPRRVASKREPDVQDSANQAGCGSLSQTSAIQLRQKQIAASACQYCTNRKWVPKSGGKQEKAPTLIAAPVRFTAAGNADRKPFFGSPVQFSQVDTLFAFGVRKNAVVFENGLVIEKSELFR